MTTSDSVEKQRYPLIGMRRWAASQLLIAADFSNYWTYAKDFLLNDHKFESNASWSLSSHLCPVSGVRVVGEMLDRGRPEQLRECSGEPGNPLGPSAPKNIVGACRASLHTAAFCSAAAEGGHHRGPRSATAHLDRPELHSIRLVAELSGRGRQAEPARRSQTEADSGRRRTRASAPRVDGSHTPAAQAESVLGYYVFNGAETDCEDDPVMTCAPVKQDARTPGIWTPRPAVDRARGRMCGRATRNWETSSAISTSPSRCGRRWSSAAARPTRRPMRVSSVQVACAFGATEIITREGSAR